MDFATLHVVFGCHRGNLFDSPHNRPDATHRQRTPASDSTILGNLEIPNLKDAFYFSGQLIKPLHIKCINERILESAAYPVVSIRI